MAVVKITHTDEINVSIATNVLSRGRIGGTNNKDKGQIYNAERHIQTEQTTAQRTAMASACAASEAAWDGARGIPQAEELGKKPGTARGCVAGGEGRDLSQGVQAVVTAGFHAQQLPQLPLKARGF